MQNEDRPMHLIELDTAIDLCFTLYASPAHFALKTKWFSYDLELQRVIWFDVDFHSDMVARLMEPEFSEVDTKFKFFVFSGTRNNSYGTRKGITDSILS